MKVLCLTVERADANAVAAALPGVVAGASATWAARFEDAAHWALANPDVSAVILDAQLGLEACGVFLSRLRRRGIGARAIVRQAGCFSSP